MLPSFCLSYDILQEISDLTANPIDVRTVQSYDDRRVLTILYPGHFLRAGRGQSAQLEMFHSRGGVLFSSLLLCSTRYHDRF